MFHMDLKQLGFYCFNINIELMWFNTKKEILPCYEMYPRTPY